MNVLNKLRFIIKTSKPQAISVIVIVNVLILVNCYYGLNKPFWNEWMDQSLSFLTILMAFFIWINSKIQEWKKSLPLKLDIIFDLNGKQYYKITNAPLTSADDIRNWSQQLGSQINNNRLLPFTGFSLSQSEGELIHTDTSSVIKYSMTIWLYEEYWSGDNKDRFGLVKDYEGKKWEYNSQGQLISKP